MSGQTLGDETFSYDAAGHLTKALNSTATVDVRYDDAGRMKEVGPVGSPTTTYTYTANRLTSRGDAAGTTGFGHEAYGRLDTITPPFSGLPSVTYQYNDAGQPTARTQSSLLSATRTYDGAGAGPPVVAGPGHAGLSTGSGHADDRCPFDDVAPSGVDDVRGDHDGCLLSMVGP